ncbi:MAG: response regulator [Ruminococcus sp.]|nr:response regulator [Ruminococcus sp.]
MKIWQRLAVIMITLTVSGIAAGIGYTYFRYISQQVYEDSTSHLTEVYNQVNKNFASFIENNWGNLDDWNNYLHIEDEKNIKTYIDSRQDYWKFTEFFFMSEDGTGINPDGKTEKFCLEKKSDSLFHKKRNIISKEILSDGQAVTLFAISVPKGVYKDFEYSAISICYTSADTIHTLDVDTFNGQSVCFITDTDGNVKLSTKAGGSIFGNYLSYLRSGSDLSENNLSQLLNDWKSHKTGIVSCRIGGVENYIYYQSVGYQNLILLGVVPVSAAGASLTKIQNATINMLTKIFLLISSMIVLWIFYKYWKAKKNIDVELRYREMMFDTLSVNRNDIFLIIDAETFKADYLSPNIERLLGIPHKTALENINILVKSVADSYRIIGKKELLSIPIHGKIHWENEHIHQGTGEHRWYRETVYHENIQGMEKYLVVMSDHTADRKMNQQLEQALDAAKSANEAKSHFLSNMSHDIRTPMNAIIGFAVLLAKDADNAEKVREYTRKISASSHHLLSLINDVLDMSKIESGKTSLNISEFSLPEMIDEIYTIMLPQAKAKNQTFEVYAGGRPTERLLGDKLHLNQILINLLSNAIKYTDTNGRIDFIVQDIPQTSPQYANIRFIVRDNGFGMKKNFLKSIFEPFAREINIRNDNIQGTGLGMAITKNLVDLMGGTIAVESELGKGSTFTVELSFALPATDKNDDIEFWKNRGISRVLVADDEEVVCENIYNIMSDVGVDVVCVNNGAAAVEEAVNAHKNNKDFHIILLDWKMPIMSGVEAAGKIREQIHSNIPILVLSSYDWSEIEEEARRAGIDAFMTKPFFASAFRHTIQTLEPVSVISEPPQNDNVLDGMKFLIAEDNELNAEILSELLEIENAEFELAGNGRIALEMFSASGEGHYDMILMDVQMPEMNGYEATRAIRSCGHPQAETIPIIAMTANAFAEDVQNAMDSGMTAHLAKPIDMNAVKSLISRLKNTSNKNEEQII